MSKDAPRDEDERAIWTKEIPIELAVRALQRMFHTFSGVDLPEENAKALLEQTKNETNEDRD
jgi:hypothetical protein